MWLDKISSAMSTRRFPPAVKPCARAGQQRGVRLAGRDGCRACKLKSLHEPKIRKGQQGTRFHLWGPRVHMRDITCGGFRRRCDNGPPNDVTSPHHVGAVDALQPAEGRRFAVPIGLFVWRPSPWHISRSSLSHCRGVGMEKDGKPSRDPQWASLSGTNHWQGNPCRGARVASLIFARSCALAQ